MTKLFIERISAERNGQIIKVIELSTEKAKEKAEWLEEIAKEYEKIPGVTDPKEYVEMLNKTSINQLVDNYNNIQGPLRDYFVESGKYEKGQILDKLPENAVLV